MISKKIFPKWVRHTDQIILEAYHGTDLQSAIEINEKKVFKPSTGKDYYLGDGVYFFENSQWHAEDWAKQRAKQYAVIRAHVALGICLDLNNGKHRRIVKAAVDVMKKRGLIISDARVINNVSEYIGIDTVRATYCQPDKGHLFEGSSFFDYTAQMICVKTKSKISKIRIVFEGSV